MMKKLMWLIKHQEEIKKMLETFNEPTEEAKPKEDKKYSVAGVPNFQKDYVNDLLNGKLENNN